MAAYVRRQLVDVEFYNSVHGQWAIDWATTKQNLHTNVMKEYIPLWFYDLRPSPTIPWPGIQPGNPWECNQRKCA